MKPITRSLLVTCLLFAAGCHQKSNEHDHGSGGETDKSPNEELYDQVMDVHNELMPKMDDLNKAKVKLNTRLAESRVLSENEKKEIQRKIARLDSANEAMLVWMRQFDPIPDSLGEEKAKAYLEAELEKVNNLKENIAQALKDAEADN